MNEQRLIDANELSKNIKAYFGKCFDSHDSEIIDDYCKEILKHNKNISKIIKEAPTVERPRSEWGNYEPYSNGYRCLHCKLIHRTCTMFCPNCGSYNWHNIRGEMREMTPEESKNYSKGLDSLYTPIKQNIFDIRGERE